ncbi:MAG: hypothetical protein LBB90_02890 [Tannerella sp.]|nr:hypothetical protein [Tannerella sp.]
MEKTELFLSDIPKLPGDGEEHYFSGGFKGINLSCGDACIQQGCYRTLPCRSVQHWKRTGRVENMHVVQMIDRRI